MLKILTVIGARPQFIKAAAISRAVRNKFSDKVKEIILHTGQHYDENMSGIFFEQLNIPRENYNLRVGSGTHGFQTARMIEGIEQVLIKEQPDCIILYGDTNSTLAGAVAASKLCIPIVHIEAGMRSFTKEVPEEINRVMCDHVSTLLFSPTITGINNLYNEGFKSDNLPPFNVNNPKVFHCGDIMYDNSMYFSEIADSESDILNTLKLNQDSYVLATIHRHNNTDEAKRLGSIFNAINNIASKNQQNIVIPLHPRTKKALEQFNDGKLLRELSSNEFVKILPSVSYLDMVALEKNAKIIITDSGGVQKEAYYFRKPCIILLNETPWVELVENGCALLADADTDKILKAYDFFLDKGEKLNFKPVFGDGHAAEFTVEMIIKHIPVN